MTVTISIKRTSILHHGQFNWFGIHVFFCKGKYPSSLTTFAYLPTPIRCCTATISIVIIIIRTIYFKHTHNREWLLFYGRTFYFLAKSGLSIECQGSWSNEAYNWLSIIVCFIHPSRQTNVFRLMSDFTKGQ